MNTADRISKVRELMKKDDVSVYIVTSQDFHGSEYTGDFFETRKFLSGFTGSAGTLVVCSDKAALFTDGRYFIQAENELCESGIDLMRMGLRDTPKLTDYVRDNIQKGTYLACDMRTISARAGIEFEEIVKACGAGFISKDYAGMLWEDRPGLSKKAAFELMHCYCGEDRCDKLLRVRSVMKENNAESHILTSLDDIAWLLNIRGGDIAYNPMVLSYLYMDMEKVLLFADRDKFDDELTGRLSDDGVSIIDYDKFDEFAGSIRDRSVMYDPAGINYFIYSSFDASVIRIEKNAPEIMMKAVKNSIECENERKAHIKDGVCVTKFIYWLKNKVKDLSDDAEGAITETDAANYLEGLRRQQEGYIEPSFTTISAYNANAAMMHYNSYINEPASLKNSGVLLVDSGGQYFEGTTDITRTICLGKISEIVKTHYTAVLRGMLKLADARFLSGCTGRNLDILARGPLWDMGLDYRCGTGHGVGYLLSVHEPPNAFRWRKAQNQNEECVLTEGMITTDEPGVYIDGQYGIRIENELLCVKDKSNEYGDFLRFETLTVAPVEMELVNLNEMSPDEIKLLRQYQQNVYDTLFEYLEPDERIWLHNVCCEF